MEVGLRNFWFGYIMLNIVLNDFIDSEFDGLLNRIF